MRMVISFSALFLSVILLQVSSGGVGPLDALTGLSLGFTKGEVGLLGSSHFIGFFVGCWWAPRIMGGVGHSRGFAVFAAMGAIGLIGHTLIAHPIAWAGLRILTGMCIAGCYTVIEAWLQSKVTNETRGRAMSAYRSIDLGASLVSQMLIGSLVSMETYVAYNLLTLLCCASLLPLALTKVEQPKTTVMPKLHPLLAMRRSPLAVVGVIVAGLSTAAYRMVGPIYGDGVGLTPGQIGIFLSLFVAGGAVAQFPAGWLADRYDRRWVLFWVSVLSIAACLVSANTSGLEFVLAASFLFGFATFPIFSIAAAHAHDFTTSDERIELSAALMFYYAVGAIASPVIASRLIDAAGPASFFWFIAIGHLALALYGLARMRVRDTVEDRTPYVYAPRTSFTIGRLLRRFRDR